LVLPRLLDLTMRNHVLYSYRRGVMNLASGLVLEIGVGSGRNLPLYGPPVRLVVGLDTSSQSLRLARQQATQALVQVVLVRASAQSIPFADATFDAIVTWTLCSIPNPIAALTEMRRVLKPGGRLLFVEHGLSPETRIARWLHRLTPYWKRIGGAVISIARWTNWSAAPGSKSMRSKPAT